MSTLYISIYSTLIYIHSFCYTQWLFQTDTVTSFWVCWCFRCFTNYKVLSFCPFLMASGFLNQEIRLKQIVQRVGHAIQTFVLNHLESDERIQRRRILLFWHVTPFQLPQQQKLCFEFISLNKFEKGPPKERSCKVLMKFSRWIRIRCHLELKVKVTPFLMPPGNYVFQPINMTSRIMKRVTKGIQKTNTFIRIKLENVVVFPFSDAATIVFFQPINMA